MARILFLTHDLPWPLDGGWRIRAHQSLRALAASHEVTLVSYTSAGQSVEELHREVPGVREVHSVPNALRLSGSPVPAARAGLRCALRRRAFSLDKFDRVPLRRVLGSLLGENRFDWAYVCNLPMWIFLKDHVGLPRILEAHNVEAELWQGLAEVAPPVRAAVLRREARLIGREERTAWGQATGVVTISPEDEHVVGQVVGAHRVHMLPASPPSPPADPPAFTSRRRAAFGLLADWEWAPSRHMLHTFLDQIATPLAREGLAPHWVVAGRGLRSTETQQLEALGAEVMGYVDDPLDFYSRVDAVLSPDLVGGGVRIKALMAMAHGRSVLGTPLTARGLPLAEGLGGWIEPGIPELRARVASLISAQDQLRSRGEQARRAIEASHDARERGREFVSKLESWVEAGADSPPV